ncbi:MAG TPA: SRPBCC family protein [Spirochaetia bacterium]|nr:SRPBCC family protein [Spirochaetia bacterium]
MNSESKAPAAGYTATARITVKATASRVWEALTDPRLVRQYLFGTDMKADWRVGGAITYTGVWEGKPYEDRGTILELVPKKLLKSSYWSAFSGKEDTPENRLIVIYELTESGGETALSITTGNNPTQDGADHSAGNWTTVLQKLKEILEK